MQRSIPDGLTGGIMKTRGMLLASAAATLVVAGGAGMASADHHEGGEAKVECQGVNGCKGQSACKTAESECSGQNSCKGKGFLKLTKEECEKAKMEMEEG
jgi:uncharacterized membrane protein